MSEDHPLRSVGRELNNEDDYDNKDDSNTMTTSPKGNRMAMLVLLIKAGCPLHEGFALSLSLSLSLSPPRAWDGARPAVILPASLTAEFG